MKKQMICLAMLVLAGCAAQPAQDAEQNAMPTPTAAEETAKPLYWVDNVNQTGYYEMMYSQHRQDGTWASCLDFADAEERRIRIMKEAGYNAVRSAHNPARVATLAAAREVEAAVGDVAGHDRHAAAAMAQMRNLLRGIGYTLGEPPAAVLSALDAALHGEALHEH